MQEKYDHLKHQLQAHATHEDSGPGNFIKLVSMLQNFSTPIESTMSSVVAELLFVSIIPPLTTYQCQVWLLNQRKMITQKLSPL